jgi:hypothetical protein
MFNNVALLCFLLQPLREYLSGKIDAAVNIADVVPEALQPEPGPAAKKQKLDGKPPLTQPHA